MRKMILLMAGLLALGQALAAKDYAFDEKSAKLGFKALYVRWMHVPGHFKAFSGAFSFDEANATVSGLSVTVQVDSIDTGIFARDHHLRDHDFFDTLDYPTAFFTAPAVPMREGQVTEMLGTLQMHGQRLPQALAVTYQGMSQTAQGPCPAFKIAAMVDRRSYGVSYGPDLLIADKVELEIEGIAFPRLQ